MRMWIAVAALAGALLVIAAAVPSPARERAPVSRLPLVIALAELDDVRLACRLVDADTLEVAWPRPASWGAARLRRVGIWIWDLHAYRGWWSVPGTFEDSGAEVSFRLPRRAFRRGARYLLTPWAQIEDDGGAVGRLAPRGTAWQAP